MNNDTQTTDKKLTAKYTNDQLVSIANKHATESQSFWDGEYKLTKRRKENLKLYLGQQDEELDGDDADRALDNRIFSSIRTVAPYATSRITQPQVAPSSKSPSSRRFAEDMERAVFIKAENEKVREKTKFALEDAIINRAGYLKVRYDAVRRNFCAVEYIPAESIIASKRARPFEEPPFYRHVLEKSVEDLITMFPDMKESILEAFNLEENAPIEDMLKEYEVYENWLFVPDKTEGLDLVVFWTYKELFLGGAKDPNWLYGQDNFLDYHMMPFIPINVLSDGRHVIDRTSYVEQAKYLQRNVDSRSQQISKNAGLGSIGMPVVDSAALADDQSQYLTYEPDTVLELDVTNAGKTSINDVFTTWKAGSLPQFVYEDKLDSRNAIDNAFGTPNVFRGEQSNNNTATQDVLVRDQAFGRQQEIVDAIDSAMDRLYKLIAQFLLVYGGQADEDGDEDGLYEKFEFIGDDGVFDYVMLNTEDLDTKVKIRVKSGTSMPIDRAQRRATADKAAQLSMIDPLSYWEIMDETNAQKYTKRLMEYTSDPVAYMKGSEEGIFSRDAFVDIQAIKQGSEPKFREELDQEYFDYLNQYVLSGDLDNPLIDMATRSAISSFIDTQLARGQKMLGMAETQLPTPQEVNAANQQTDQLNQADMLANQNMAKQPVQQELLPSPIA